MAETKIEWADYTFNPWRGCTKVSAGCKNCYAETQSKRNPKVLGIWSDNGMRVVASETGESGWSAPLKWNAKAKALDERHRVFCASMADVFEDWKGVMTNSQGKEMIQGRKLDAWTMNDARQRLFNLIDQTPNLDWLILTKRPENIARMMPPFVTQYIPEMGELSYREDIRPNVWLGTSVENQEQFGKRAIELLRIPASVSFLSAEPLLGPIRLNGFGTTMDPVTMITEPRTDRKFWVIVGGESGGGARPCRIEWVRSIVEQCKAAGVPVFVKQLGAEPMGDDQDAVNSARSTRHALGTIILANRKGGDIEEFPNDLQVREFPRWPTL